MQFSRHPECATDPCRSAGTVCNWHENDAMDRRPFDPSRLALGAVRTHGQAAVRQRRLSPRFLAFSMGGAGELPLRPCAAGGRVGPANFLFARPPWLVSHKGG